MAFIRWKDKTRDTAINLIDRFPVTTDPGGAAVDKYNTREDLKTLTSISKTNVDSPYTLLSTDEYVRLDATSGNIIVNLPTLASQELRPIKLVRTDNSSNTVTVQPQTVGELLGDTSFILPVESTINVIPDVTLGKWVR